MKRVRDPARGAATFESYLRRPARRRLAQVVRAFHEFVWNVAPPPRAVERSARPREVAPRAAGSNALPASPVSGEALREAESQEEAPAEPNPFGSVLVRVLWGDDRTPAAGVHAWLIPWGSPDLYLDFQEATSGPDGTIHVDRVYKGGATVTLDRGGSGKIEVVPGEESVLELEVPPGLTVEGTVVDRRGLAIGGARIWLAWPGGHTSFGSEVALTAPDGSFRLHGVSSNTYLGARARGRSTSYLRYLEGEMGATLSVQLVLRGEGGTVRGQVLDSDSAPINTAWALIDGPYPVHCLRDLRPGSGEVAVQVPRQARSSAFLTGTVLDPEGVPAGGARITLSCTDLGAVRYFSTEQESGAFLIGPLPPAPYRLVLQAQGYPDLRLDEKELLPGQTLDLGALFFRRPGQ